MEDRQGIEKLRRAFPFLKLIGSHRLLLENPEQLPDILHFLADKKMPVLRIERREPTLEDLFMEVIGK